MSKSEILKDNENNRLYKKDEIIEIVESDEYNGVEYPVGSMWRIYKDSNNEATAFIRDERQKGSLKEAVLWTSNIKLVKEKENTINEEEKILINAEDLLSNIYKKDMDINHIIGYLEGYLKGAKQ